MKPTPKAHAGAPWIGLAAKLQTSEFIGESRTCPTRENLPQHEPGREVFWSGVRSVSIRCRYETGF